MHKQIVFDIYSMLLLHTFTYSRHSHITTIIMSGAGPASVLFQPGTEYARNMNGTMGAPWASGMTSNSSPFGGGIGNPMANAIPGLNGTSSYNPSRGPALGAYDQLNFHLCVDFDRFEHFRTGGKQLTFVSRRTNGITHDMKGLSCMNQYLHSSEGMDLYGKDRTLFNWNEDWSFYGVPVNNTMSDLAETSDKCMALHVGKRARVVNPACMIRSADRSNKPAVSIGDHMYLLVRRFKYVDTIKQIFGKSAAVDRHYWRIDPFVSPDKTPPNQVLYNSEYGKGMSIFVGSIYTVYGETHINTEAVATAREAFHPVSDDVNYVRKLAVGFDIDLNLGVR